MKQIILLLLLLQFAPSIFSQDIKGKWHGILKVQGAQLRVDFNISQSGNEYTATMDSPDQNTKGIPVSSVTFEDSKLKITISNIQIEYNGIWQKDSITGTFSQFGSSYPMNLYPNEVEKKSDIRPQEPKPPYPYYSEEVIFTNKKAGITLSGTLTLPDKKGKYPVAVMITGSGAQNRDEELFGHKPFLVIADFLTRNGIGVLRFDDRGTGKSQGSFQGSTSLDFATDVEAALMYLQSRKDVAQKNIGLIGHSEGGSIAFMVAATSTIPRFIISLAGVGIHGDDLLLSQQSLLLEASGIGSEQIEQTRTFNKGAFDIVIKSTDSTQLANDLKNYLENSPLNVPPSGMDKNNYMKIQLKSLINPWMVTFIKSHPEDYLKKVKCPVLAMNGSKDLQVPAEINLNTIKQVLNNNGNKNAIIKEFPGLNHLFQTCDTGLPTEYGEIQETISPAVLNEMLQWLQSIIKK